MSKKKPQPSQALPSAPPRKAPSWVKLRRRRKALRARRPSDAFLRDLLKGAFRVGADARNPIRGNLMASALRELVTHLLHTLAPEADVRKCSWFVQDPQTNTVTRAQRATYMAQGGLSAAFVKGDLKLNVPVMIRPLVRGMDDLNKFTHLKAHTILADDLTIRSLVADVLDTIDELYDSAETCRRAVGDTLAQHVDQALFDKLIDDVVDDLDELSTHTTVEEQESEEIVVVDIDHELISFAVTGRVYVRLQYGSDSDVRNDMGAVSSDSFPYRATLQAEVAKPTEPLRSSVELTVDNSSFYQ